ncbi:streptophobe family protein [Streptomyces sp. NPDC048664]|uniref:streptophobe family protein n=1 Tax=Streptomyces sp. NPDC048664 TaxID=3154505 RepID=UPI0034464F16
MNIETAEHGGRLPWARVLLCAVASVGWALAAMAATAALGLHLLGADAEASLGPMTAAVVALGVNGSVTPSGNVSVFGLTGPQARTDITLTPLGVGLVGALVLSWVFLRSLRTAGVEVAPAELLARAGSVLLLFTALLGGLAWAGHDVVTLDGAAIGLDRPPGGPEGAGGIGVPGLGPGDVGGLLPSGIGDLVQARAAVGFSVDGAATLLGGAGWCAGVLLVALLASRRTPLPRHWDVVHRVARPAVSALVTALLVAVGAGWAAAVCAAIGDDRPARIVGAALLGAPNGVWPALSLGLLVPWDGAATGVLAGLLPAPLDRLVGSRAGRPVTLGRLAELDGRVGLLALAAALLMLCAGVLTAVRTPCPRSRGSAPAADRASAAARDPGPVVFAVRCALRLGTATACGLPLLVLLTDVSVNASLSVFGFDAFGAGVELHGRAALALPLGAVWGAGAGAAGALLAYGAGAAGSRAVAPPARGAARTPGPVPSPRAAASPDAAAPRPAGPYHRRGPYRPPNIDTKPYLRLPDTPPAPRDAPQPRDREREPPPPPSWPPGWGRD